MTQKRKLLIVLKYLVNPVLAILMLWVCVWFYLGMFEENYLALLVLTFFLSIELIEGVDFESDIKIFWKKKVVGLVLQWFWVISLLLLIGFAFKVTDYFSRQALITWILITPVVLVMTHWLIRALLHRCPFSRKKCPE